MSKKRIGIDINEVIRALWHQFDKYYIEEFGDNNVSDNEIDCYTMNFWEDYHWENSEETINYLNEDLPDDISPLEYQVDKETGEAPVDHMAFKPETETISARDSYKRFMYQDYLLEIHGMANTMYRGCEKDIEKFYFKYKDQFNISYVSIENYLTVAPTLFFLSKTNTKIMDYNFVENEKDIWNNIDILITANPKLISNVPEGKKVVKIIRPFNEDIEGSDFEEYNVVNLVEIYERNDNGDIIKTNNNDEFDEFIEYIKSEKNN